MTLQSEKTRDFSLDNIRFFLIFTVVFAHLLEVCRAFSGSGYIYQFIYMFHMPVFIFLFGYNVRYSPNKVIFRWCIPYIVFQSLYLLFSLFVLDIKVNFQYTTPYWLLWYMLSCIFYQLLLPLYETTNKNRQILTLICAFIISLVIGFDETIGYYMSLSRFFVFQPWFLLGFYCKKNGILEQLVKQKKITTFVMILSAVLIGLSALLLYYTDIENGLLYGALPYIKCGGALWMRVIVSIASICWILFLFVGVKPYLNKKLFLITTIGQNTLPIFLLHGFFVKTLPIYLPHLLHYPWAILPLTCLMLLVFGNKIFNKAIYYISFSWLERFTKNF